MLHSWCTQAVTVHRAALVDARGSKVRDWNNAATHRIGGCSVQPAATGSDEFNRAEQSTNRWTLYAPPGTDVQRGDRVEFGGTMYEVDGTPYDWQSPTGRVSHRQANLVEWVG